MRRFGLIGYPLAQSFSKKYFTEKFEKENITGCTYQLYPIENITALPALLAAEQLSGLNVTIPYKEQVLAYLHDASDEVKAIGACNCIKISGGRLTGYNTDAPAFENTLAPLLQPYHTHALILGTGGAAKAVAYVLQKLGIQYQYISRQSAPGRCAYHQVSPEMMATHLLIINCTPLGSYPNTENYPDIPHRYITGRHILYDLVYNPPVTAFLAKGAERGAVTINGYAMLAGQAELGWQIWNTAY